LKLEILPELEEMESVSPRKLKLEILPESEEMESVLPHIVALPSEIAPTPYSRISPPIA
jgi:hypothetical protein